MKVRSSLLEMALAMLGTSGKLHCAWAWTFSSWSIDNSIMQTQKHHHGETTKGKRTKRQQTAIPSVANSNYDKSIADQQTKNTLHDAIYSTKNARKDYQNASLPFPRS
jgi:hypothetical protein